MSNSTGASGVDRRLFLATTAASLVIASGDGALAQEQKRASAANGPALAQAIAQFTLAFDLKSAPPELVARSRIAFIDTIGVMLGGAHEDVAALARNMIMAEESAPRATIASSALRTSPQLAAMANGVAAHAMDYDFSYASGQAISPVIPALLPMAETLGSTPLDVIAAFIIGAEVAARLVRTMPKISALGGWHAVGMVGPVATAAACARLMKLPAPAIVDAIGIAASLSGGVSANFGTMTKPLHSGVAARNGIMAALLASKGFTSSRTALEGKSGYFDTFNRALPQTDGAFGDLGTRYDLLTRGYKLKRYPCGGLGHTAIDATLLLREQLGGRVGEIARVEAGITKNAAQRIKDAYPDTIESAKFSMPYIGAWTILNGPPSLRTFTMESIGDAQVKALSTKITHHVDAEFADEVEEAPGRVRVTLTNGQVLEQKVWYASGSPQNQMTPAQIEAKFMDCAMLTKKEADARRLFAFVSDLPNRSSFDGFWPLLGAG